MIVLRTLGAVLIYFKDRSAYNRFTIIASFHYWKIEIVEIRQGMVLINFRFNNQKIPIYQVIL